MCKERQHVAFSDADGLLGVRAFGAPGPALPLSSAVAAPATAVVATQPMDPILVDSMAEHMQAVHGDQAGEMLKRCT